MFSKKNKYVVGIDGMKCANCSNHMSSGFKKIDGVVKVDIDLDKKEATITSKLELSEEVIKETVEEVGYRFLYKKDV